MNAMNGYDSQRPTDAPQYKRCPDCEAVADWDTMVWINGRTCPACYAERRRVLNAKMNRRENHETDE